MIAASAPWEVAGTCCYDQRSKDRKPTDYYWTDYHLNRPKSSAIGRYYAVPGTGGYVIRNGENAWTGVWGSRAERFPDRTRAVLWVKKTAQQKVDASLSEKRDART